MPTTGDTSATIQTCSMCAVVFSHFMLVVYLMSCLQMCCACPTCHWNNVCTVHVTVSRWCWCGHVVISSKRRTLFFVMHRLSSGCVEHCKWWLTLPSCCRSSTMVLRKSLVDELQIPTFLIFLLRVECIVILMTFSHVKNLKWLTCVFIFLCFIVFCII